MLAVSPSSLIPSAEDFRARLQDEQVTDKGAVVTELARATYVGNGAPFQQLTAREQLPYLELLRDITGNNAIDGVSRNNAFTALNAASRYKIEGAATLVDEALTLLPPPPKPKGKSAGEDSQVVEAAVNGMHLGDWINAGRPVRKTAKPDGGTPPAVA